jgi:hypothetical protein
MLKNPAEYERDISSAKFTAIYRQISRDSRLGVSVGICQTTLVNELGMIRAEIEIHSNQNGRSAWDALYDTTP